MGQEGGRMRALSRLVVSSCAISVLAATLPETERSGKANCGQNTKNNRFFLALTGRHATIDA
jgi:hypothetical protein